MRNRILPVAAAVLCIGAAFSLPTRADEAPPLFKDDGTIPNASVQVGKWLENLDTQPNNFDVPELPFVAKDSTGALIVAQDGTLRKFVYSEQLGQWLYEWQRVYFSNEINASQYVTAPTPQNPSPPTRYNTTYVEYWSNGSEQLTLKYQPGNNGNSAASTPIAQFQYIDNPYQVEIDERDRILIHGGIHGSDRIEINGLKIDASNNIYVAIRAVGRESTLVTKFSPTGDVLWREQTVPGGDNDGKEGLAGDNLVVFELSPSGDKLYTVEAEGDFGSQLSVFSGGYPVFPALQLKQKSYRRSVFLTTDDTGPSPRRTTFHGGVASAYRVATSVIPSPGWENNTQYRHQFPLRAVRDGNGLWYVLFRESDPTRFTGPDGEVPLNVTEDRSVVRVFDADWTPLPRKIEFLDINGYIPADIQAAADGSLYVLTNFQSETLPVEANVRRYQTTGTGESAVFEEVWSRFSGSGTYAQQLVLEGGTLTTFGNGSESAVWQVARLSTSGTQLWLRTTPLYTSTLQRYRTATSLIKGWVDAAGNALLLGRYTDYLPTTGSTVTPNDFCYAKYAADGDLQFIRQLGDQNLDPGGYSVFNPGSGIFHGDLLVVPARLVKADENGPDGDSFDYPGALLAFGNPANVDAPPFEITNDSVINVDSFNRSFSIDLTTNSPAWVVTGSGSTDIVAGGGLVGENYFPVLAGSELEYGTYQKTVYAFGAHGMATKNFTIHVTPRKVTITGQPESREVQKNGPGIVQVLADGDSLLYQWQSRTTSGGVWKNIKGATGATLNVPSVKGRVFYRCRVYNKIGSALNSEVYSNSSTLAPDVTKPAVFVTAPAKGVSTATTTNVKGLGTDNVAIAGIEFRYRFAGGAFSAAKQAVLSAGDMLRTYTASVPSKAKGDYTVEFVITDTSGNSTKATYSFTRK